MLMMKTILYKAKPNKKVLTLSSMQSSVEIEKKDTRIPETIKFHNSAKFGVDVTDQMARKYSVKSKCQRWPLQRFNKRLHNNLRDFETNSSHTKLSLIILHKIT
uniref:DDE_Tnp_1_7 domain-containing protein n=1 Tax=Glossina austeni TaxID=7395 RepID=A0A1A9VT26_GLOAU